MYTGSLKRKADPRKPLENAVKQSIPAWGEKSSLGIRTRITRILQKYWKSKSKISSTICWWVFLLVSNVCEANKWNPKDFFRFKSIVKISKYHKQIVGEILTCFSDSFEAKEYFLTQNYRESRSNNLTDSCWWYFDLFPQCFWVEKYFCFKSC